MEANTNVISVIANNQHAVVNSVFGPMTADPINALGEMPSALTALLADVSARRVADQKARDLLEKEAEEEDKGRSCKRLISCIQNDQHALRVAMAALIHNGYLS